MLFERVHDGAKSMSFDAGQLRNHREHFFVSNGDFDNEIQWDLLRPNSNQRHHETRCEPTADRVLHIQEIGHDISVSAGVGVDTEHVRRSASVRSTRHALRQMHCRP